MTDKQIIIDGVDVSGCPYYIDSDGSCSSHDCECIKCVHNACFYKDLKAKEQECEELKKYKKVVDKLASMQVILTNEEKMPMLYENAKDLKLKQLSKTLTEIKEIANYSFDLSTSELLAKLEQILQKISEVENE